MKHLRLYGAAAGLAILALDQFSKTLALTLIHEPVTVFPFFNLVLVWNRGISFGLFTQNSAAGPILLTALSLLIAAGIGVWLWNIKKRGMALALGAIIGGALGNVVDRLRFGAVVDFLDFHAFGWHWPAFNAADSAIVLGIAFIAADGLFFDPEAKRHDPAQKY